MRRKNIFNTAILLVENFDLKNIILRQKEIIDDFCMECVKDPDGNDVYRVVDPVHVLLNQERLENTLGNSAAKNFIDSFRNQKNDPFAELRANCTDEDLMTLIKSRHLQSPAEILSWTKYMSDNMNYFTSEVQKLVDARQSQVVTPSVDNVDTSDVSKTS